MSDINELKSKLSLCYGDIDTTLYIMSDINELKSKLSLCYGDIDTTDCSKMLTSRHKNNCQKIQPRTF